jgi:LPXTG-motif cell wall-anchored protein
MKPVRLIFVVLASMVALVGLQRSASAAPLNCFVSATTVAAGGSFTISGPGDVNAEHIVALFDSATVIGGGFTNTTGTPIDFSFSATIPSTTAPNTTHHLQVRNDAGASAPCSDIFVTAAAAAATPSPTPVVTPVPTTAPVAVATFPPFPIILQQQQQQQQQQGGGGSGGSGGRGGQQQQHSAGPGGQQQQQQSADGILPRTGVDIGKTAAWGGGLLAFGLLLVMFARRRRRVARSRALAALPPIDAVVVESDEPWMPGTAHPSEFLTEADGLPPVYLPEAEQLYLPPAPEADADDDVLTPSF